MYNIIVIPIQQILHAHAYLGFQSGFIEAAIACQYVKRSVEKLITKIVFY